MKNSTCTEHSVSDSRSEIFASFVAVQLGSILLEDGAILDTLWISGAPASDHTVRALIKLVINIVRLLRKTRGGNVIIQNNRGGQLDEGKVKIVTEMTILLIPMN